MLITLADRETRDFYIFSFSQYSTARAYTNLDVVTLQLGINDISNNTYGLTDLQRFIPKIH
jgi:lysophospholipase L1-like esterase